MALARVLQVLSKGGPIAAKQLPKLWPLLLESRNREKITQAAHDLASQSPRRRLGARLDLTAALAVQINADATTDDERADAAAWATRARNLSRRLEMPVAGRRAKAAHLRAIRTELDALQAEMNAHLPG